MAQILKWRHHLPLLLLLILALSLRLPQLNSSFWLDEAAQALESARPLSQQLDIIPDFQPPLIHLIVHFSLYFSDSEWWLRSIAALLPGLITIWATYQIGKVLVNQKVGVIAALLLATSSFHIFYSQELRPYSLPTMFAVVSWWWIFRQSASRTPQKLFWLGWVCLSLGGWYSSYLYPFLWVSQTLYLMLSKPKQRGSLVLSCVSIGLGFAVWAPRFLQQLAAGQELQLSLPSWQNIVSFSQLKTLPLVTLKFIFGVLNVEPTLPFLMSSGLLSVLGILSLWSLFKPARAGERLRLPTISPTLLALGLWLVLPLILAWLVSFLLPIIQPKRVLFLLPAAYLLLAWLIVKTPAKIMANLLLTLLLLINGFATRQYYFKPEYQRENWRALQATLQQHYSPTNTIVVFAFPEPFAPWRWYDRGYFKTLSLGYLTKTPSDQTVTQLKVMSQSQNVVTFDYLQELSDPQNLIRQELKAFGYQNIEIIDYPNLGFTRVDAQKGVTVSDSSVTIEP